MHLVIAKDEVVFKKASRQLALSSPDQIIWVQNSVHILYLIANLEEKNRFKNPMTVVYTPGHQESDTFNSAEFPKFLDLCNQYLKKDETYFTKTIEEFIKTQEEIEEEMRIKRIDIQNKFLTKLRKEDTE